MAEIHDLEIERTNREMEALVKEAETSRPFAIDLDLRKLSVCFTGHCAGPGGTNDDMLRILVYDTSGPSVRPFGAIRARRDQWEEMRRFGETMLSAQASVGQASKS